MFRGWLTVICTFVLVAKESFSLPSTCGKARNGGIIFPEENFDDCYVDEASLQPGECKLVDKCPDVLEKWQQLNVYPKTCYFIKNDHYVCCPKGQQAPVTTTSAPMPAVPTTALPSITILPTSSSSSSLMDFTTRSFLELLGDNQTPSDLECELNQVVQAVVVNGLPTKRNEFPFMAALGWKANIGDSIWYRCGGAIISNQYILTAAHCADLGGAFATTVRLGGSNLTDPAGRNVNIRRFISHPDYKGTDNDIALVELEQPLKNFGVACLWAEPELTTINVTALGYGSTQFSGISSDQLLKAPLKVVGQEECAQFYRSQSDIEPLEVKQAHLCANNPEEKRDTCQGDSGGPLIMQGPFRRQYIVGITSLGLGCTGVQPSIYTRVSSYIKWIEDIVWPRFDTRIDGN